MSFKEQQQSMLELYAAVMLGETCLHDRECDDKNEMASLMALGIYRTHLQSFCIDNLHHISRDYQMSSCRITMDMLLSIKTEDSVLEHCSRNEYRYGEIQASICAGSFLSHTGICCRSAYWQRSAPDHFSPILHP